jgi:DNA-binding transcriptional regulator YiaG
MANKYQSEILGVVHEMMDDLHKNGIIYSSEMKEFDKGCLTPEPYTSSQTKAASPSIHKPALAANSRA